MLSLIEEIHKAGDNAKLGHIYIHVLEEVNTLAPGDVSVPSQCQACCHSLGFSL
jgi:hypothetical protein